MQLRVNTALVASAVYPRACGGTSSHAMVFAGHPWCGLSPRLRGNRSNMVASRGASEGSIPAPAGEPDDAGCRLECGYLRSIPAPAGEPSSPVRCVAEEGSIPAPAGEPGRRCVGRWTNQVYPRACGGTHARSPHTPHSGPRVYPRACGGTMMWSNVQRDSAERGSIPAPAGEPD